MSEEDDFLRQTRRARTRVAIEDKDTDEDSGSSIADRRLARRMAAMRDESDDEAPAQDDALVSEGTKQALKKAGALAAIAGKWSAGKAKEGALLAAEKAKAAKVATDKALAEREAKRAETKNAQAVAVAVVEVVEDAAPLQELDGNDIAMAIEASGGQAELEPDPVGLVEPPAPSYVTQDAAPTKTVQVVAQPVRVVSAPRPGKSGKTLALMVGAVVALAAAGGGAYWWSQQKPEPKPVPVVIKAAPVVAPAPAIEPVLGPDDMPFPVNLPVPEPATYHSLEVPEEPVAVAPAPVIEPKAEPVPVAQPAPAAKKPELIQAKPAAPKPAAVKKPAPTPVAKPKPAAPKEAWQDKAQDDMAEFEKAMGIE